MARLWSVGPRLLLTGDPPSWPQPRHLRGTSLGHPSPWPGAALDPFSAEQPEWLSHPPLLWTTLGGGEGSGHHSQESGQSLFGLHTTFSNLTNSFSIVYVGQELGQFFPAMLRDVCSCV